MSESEDEFLPDNDALGSSAGAQLRAARERKGLTLDQVAADTRISRRNLTNLENGDFDDMPGRPYVVGFARTYAKSVGLPDEEIVALVREELAEAAAHERYDQQGRGTFEPGDPARGPGGGLLYFSLFAVVVLLIGIFFAARALFAPAAEIPSLVEQQQREEAEAAAARQAAAQQARQPAAVQTGSAVVFTAEGETWVRFYDGEGSVLQEGTMREGESFTVPADAVNPQLITGRPDRLAITVGGRPVAKLSTEVETVQDVPISAQALLARGGGVATVGFGLGTSAETAPEPAEASDAPATRPAPQSATTSSAPTRSPAPINSPTPAYTPSPAPTATPSASTPSPQPTASTPSPAATAPPQGEPADAADDNVAAAEPD